MKTMIETERLTKRFGELTAVEDVSLRVAEGEVLALLGPNGAGKTTTIRMLASILQPSSGRAWIAGYDVAAQPEAVRRSVGVLNEHHGLYMRMNALDYLRFFGQVYAIPAGPLDRRIHELAEFYGIADALHRRLGEYSKGMRQKLALVRTLLHEPPVLLLDEPTSAMDPESARLVRGSIRQIRGGRRAIIICTHNLPEAEELADRIAIIREGKIVAFGSVPEVKQALLGDPIMELRLAQSLNGVIDSLPSGAEPLDTGDRWLRYRARNPQEVNPLVLRMLANRGIPVVTLSEITRSLEEVYLQVVAGRRSSVVEPDER